MVLQELGSKLTGALKKLQTSAVVDAILQEISRALLEADVNVQMVGALRRKIKEQLEENEEVAKEQNQKKKLIQQLVMSGLTEMVDPGVPAYKMKKGKSNVIMFVGLQGSGKTTTIAKVAHYYSRKGWRVAMVCADTFRAGAFDQLKQNAVKLRVPFYGSYTEADPVRLAEEGVAQFRREGYELIIVDTSGRHRQEEALFEEMQEIHAVVEPDNVVFVMDATQGQAIQEQAEGFKAAVDVGACVITKLDGHAKGGGALSAVAATKSPIRGFVSKLLGFGDLGGLLAQLHDGVSGERKQEMLENLAKGKFTLRDLYEQFQNMMKLGPMHKVLGMMPGIPQWMAQAGKDQETGNRFKRFMYMMDSMTDKELDGVVELCDSRILRIARGSGTHTEVRALLACHRSFEGMVGQFGKAGLMGALGGGPGGGGGASAAQQRQMAQMMKDPKKLAQLQRNMDPALLKQMGGVEGMQNAMKMMQGGGMPGMPGMPDLGGGGGLPGMPGMDMDAMRKMMGL
eukprot:CAMPEP_0206408698 /NCGR_PEP_ID=MMETSP0294-20121207/31333_1 /ASSEMBLY_ACC=CAM_ASM_000327 /TAXON_ID=39354 /ORGANISM="Heterosigma akashiwo, Strain CCMP2393" /LENGTH=511 /DNA_ID=CAMNT_0053868265 /DNA_START=39 /DNA_END=1575 /DNA_ORIENTATION=+